MSIIFISFLFLVYLIVINSLLTNFNISLDKETKNETHKSFVNKLNNIPLSGTLYFLPIIIFLIYDKNFLLVFFCSLLFIIGFLADLKFIQSYKIRLAAQFFVISLFFLMDKNILINIRIQFFDNLMNYEYIRIFICTFFFMVLINGFNLIDGTNSLCSLNFLIITVFTLLVINRLEINYLNFELRILLIALLIFIVLNFFGKNFLGDGAAYGFSFFIGYILLKISLINYYISPYFIANLLLYPALENLFSILRRTTAKKNNYLPDNKHLHHLIFRFFKKKFLIKKMYLLSSIVGITINSLLLVGYTIGFLYISNTKIQIFLIVFFIFIYLVIYFTLAKKFINSRS